MTFQFFRRNAPAMAHGGGELKDLCPQFVRDFKKWIDAFPASAACADEIPEEIDRLEKSWCSLLCRIECLQARDLADAIAQYEVAQMYAEWASCGDGRASALIAAASRSLHEFAVSRAAGGQRPTRDQMRVECPPPDRNRSSGLAPPLD